MTPLFSRFVLSHASNNTTSQNIGGAIPHLKFWGGPSPLKSPPMVVSCHCDIHHYHKKTVTCQQAITRKLVHVLGLHYVENIAALHKCSITIATLVHVDMLVPLHG